MVVRPATKLIKHSCSSAFGLLSNAAIIMSPPTIKIRAKTPNTRHWTIRLLPRPVAEFSTLVVPLTPAAHGCVQRVCILIVGRVTGVVLDLYLVQSVTYCRNQYASVHRITPPEFFCVIFLTFNDPCLVF